jgi:predicted DCC family thiol-disulfide oxidoreductase YuxK
LTLSGSGRPLLVYDGDCSFCVACVRYLQARTGSAIEYAPFQKAAASLPQIPLERFREAVQLITPAGEVRSGACAVFEALAAGGAPQWAWAYRRIPGFASAAEAAYRVVARHRPLFWKLTTLAFGPVLQPLRYEGIEWLFLRALGLVYLMAFVSFGVQASGLIGTNGILPLGPFLGRASEVLGGGAWRQLPTVFWLGSSDAAIRAVWIAGAACALLVIAGVLERPALALACALYLSLTVAGQDFMGFQWDGLLIEAGFLAIFLGWSRGVVWLYRWLVFRLMFESGAVKLASGDPTWRNLSALEYHFHTQPLPTPVAWYAAHLPRWLHIGMCAATLGIELGLPWLVFAPRRFRHFAGYGLVLFQCIIALTGNYAFFNPLTVMLGLFLFDDDWLGRFARRRRSGNSWVPARVRRALVAAVAVIATAAGGLQLYSLFRGEPPAPGRQFLQLIGPFQIVNPYGLFAVMTTRRPEIVVEGSNDGATWLPYEFHYKPGPLNRQPPWVAPYQPRLDWQMWFAALSNYRMQPWFVSFLARLLEGSPDVLRLLARNPFPGHPPRFARATV